jgi:carbamoyl-phosphate synthase large subunit
MIKNEEVDFIVNTTEGKQAIADSATIRRSALQYKVFYTTTISGGEACVEALRHGLDRSVHRLQELHQRL